MTQNWTRKLTNKGLKLIEASARLQSLGPPPFSDHQAFAEWIAQYRQIQASYPELVDRRSIRVTPDFIDFYRLGDSEIADQFSREELVSLFKEEIWPASMANGLETAERLWKIFEADPKERARAYLMLGSWIPTIGEMMNDMKVRQFGQAEINDRKSLTVIAQVLEWFGSAMRGRTEMPGGRVNVDRAKLVNALLTHQKEKLTQLELYEALKEAGAELPGDPEAFRGWLHKARKSGLVRDTRDREPAERAGGRAKRGKKEPRTLSRNHSHP